jgi:hypothetical protein
VSRSVSLALTPTIYFFNFLNYTDSLSLMLMTMAYYYNLINSRKRLFLCSMLAVMVRQNNIVWLGYLALYRTTLDHKELFSNNKTFISHITGIAKALLSNKTYLVKQFKYQLALLIVFFGYLKKFNNGRLVFGDVENHTVTFHHLLSVNFSWLAGRSFKESITQDMLYRHSCFCFRLASSSSISIRTQTLTQYRA